MARGEKKAMLDTAARLVFQVSIQRPRYSVTSVLLVIIVWNLGSATVGLLLEGAIFGGSTRLVIMAGESDALTCKALEGVVITG